MPTFGVLGALRVVGDDGTEIPLTGSRQRRLLSALLLHRGRVVSADRLGELVWDLDTMVDPAALQSLVFRLRQRVPMLELEFRAPGYVLHVDDEQLDATRFERSVLDAVARRTDDPAGAATLLDVALGLWRGEPFHDLADADDGRAESTRLRELHCRAQEERFELAIDHGRGSAVLADLEAFAIREPLRERPQHLLMRAYVAAGRRADALRVYDAHRLVLAAELGVAPSPELRRRHEELLAVDDTVPSDPAPAVRRPSRRGLRRPPTPLIGRDDVLDAALELLGRTRLVTLVGPGGVGKTRVATEIAHRLATDRADDVIFCDLTTASPDTVVDVVIGALAVERRADRSDIDRLVEVLRHEHGLLVLDNCEHVLDGAAEMAERLADSTEHLRVLATSRERLAVDGEHLIPVPPLAHDGIDSAASRLLAERMTAIAGRRPDADEIEVLDALARRLDGLPLALELAAARLQSLTVQEVLEGVDSSIDLLRGGRRTVDRHRSVEAALRWTYDVLDESTRAALCAAAVFTAPFHPADIGALLGLGAGAALERSSALIERSLAVRDGERIRLLHVVRTFAREQSSADERDRLEREFTRRMGDVARSLRSELRVAADSTPIDEYLLRIADFRRAIELSLDRDDAATALDMVVSLRDLAFNSSSSELQRWAEAAAAAGERIRHPATIDALAVSSLGAWKQGALDDMRRMLARAEELGEAWGTGTTYELLGAQATEDLAHGALDRAIDRLTLADQLPDVRSDAVRLAETRGTLVICKAYAHHPDAVTIADAMADESGAATSAIATAWCHYASGECRIESDPVAARRHLDLAVADARAGGSTFIEGIAGASLASLEVRSGDVAAAVATYRWLVPLWTRAGLQTPLWTGMRFVAELLERAGEDVPATRVLGAVMTPGAGHDVFGADEQRLAALQGRLRDRMGATSFEAEFRAGSTMDEAAVAHEATAAFDRITDA